jgi:hypothetical protein
MILVNREHKRDSKPAPSRQGKFEKPKRESKADKKWIYDFACELDAIPPDEIRRLVEDAILQHVDLDQLEILRIAEESERQQLGIFAKARHGDR